MFTNKGIIVNCAKSRNVYSLYSKCARVVHLPDINMPAAQCVTAALFVHDKHQHGEQRKSWRQCYRLDEKALRETQTLRAGCSKAEPKIFALPQTPFPGAQDGQNLISWRWSPSPTDQVW